MTTKEITTNCEPLKSEYVNEEAFDKEIESIAKNNTLNPNITEVRLINFYRGVHGEMCDVYVKTVDEKGKKIYKLKDINLSYGEKIYNLVDDEKDIHTETVDGVENLHIPFKFSSDIKLEITDEELPERNPLNEAYIDNKSVIGIVSDFTENDDGIIELEVREKKNKENTHIFKLSSHDCSELRDCLDKSVLTNCEVELTIDDNATMISNFTHKNESGVYLTDELKYPLLYPFDTIYQIIPLLLFISISVYAVIDVGVEAIPAIGMFGFFYIVAFSIIHGIRKISIY